MTSTHPVSVRVTPEGYVGQDKIRLDGANPETIESAIQNRTILSAMVNQVQGDAIFVHIGGEFGSLTGVMLKDEFDDREYAGYQGFVGDIVDILILEYNAEHRVVKVSRRQARETKRHQLLDSLQEGMVVPGVVRSIQNFGAFVDIGGIHAILPVNEIKHEYVTHPGDVLRRGDALDVKVIEFKRDGENDTAKIRVSLKALSNPWAEVGKTYQRNAIVLGEVVAVDGSHVYVRPTPTHGVDLLCPASVHRTYRIGHQVRVRVVAVDPEKRKLRGRIIGVVR